MNTFFYIFSLSYLPILNFYLLFTFINLTFTNLQYPFLSSSFY
ncbi:hypothetical protein CLOM621_09024 [Clostridium sp. M62/1]|nr:hypothetical protein CLOM621_09024 [Clostridium sp. M62/1]